MPTRSLAPLVCVLLLTLAVAAPAEDYGYITTNGTATITRYTGPGGAVNIPDTLGGLPVTVIGRWAFQFTSNLTSVAIPATVTGIDAGAFYGCSNLISARLGPAISYIGNLAFLGCGLTNFDIPGGVTVVGLGVFYGCFNLAKVTIPSSVTNIAYCAFSGCTSLTSVTIPSSVVYIGQEAFFRCTNLTSAFFWGNAPGHPWDIYPVFGSPTVLYYLPGTIGWDDSFWQPQATWFLPNPVILTDGSGFGPQPAGFGFTISWATNASVVVEASRNLASPSWLPLATNTLLSGSSYFSDPEWRSHSQRLYRVREK